MSAPWVTVSFSRSMPANGLKAEPVVRATTPRGETVYWVGAAGAAADAGEGTDFHAVSQSQVSLTPLQIDLTQTAQLQTIRQWLA